MPVGVVIVILIFALIVIVIVVFVAIRRQEGGNPPAVLLEASGRNFWQHDCGEGGTLYANQSGRAFTVSISVRVRDEADCNVTFSTGAAPKFLEVPVQRPRRGAAAIALADGDAITYRCQNDASGRKCEFDVTLTRI